MARDTSQLAAGKRAYSAQLNGALSQLREALGLYRLHSTNVSARVAARIAEMGEVQQILEQTLGAPLRDKRMLDVGAGQGLFHMAYFGMNNDLTGIDLEVIAQGFDVPAYLSMWRVNGTRRTLKTAGRKLLQVDRHYRHELMRQCGLERLPKMEVLQMDATAMSFADATFDVVHAHSVFHHLPSPERGLREVVRVLKPGGAAYVSFHLYTSDTGSLDPRVMRGSEGLPPWPHLRAASHSKVLQNAFLNKLRLEQWRALLANVMPGARLETRAPAEEAKLRATAEGLQAQGELTDYTLEELVTRRVVVLWRKP